MERQQGVGVKGSGTEQPRLKSCPSPQLSRATLSLRLHVWAPRLVHPYSGDKSCFSLFASGCVHISKHGQQCLAQNRRSRSIHLSTTRR